MERTEFKEDLERNDGNPEKERREGGGEVDENQKNNPSAEKEAAIDDPDSDEIEKLRGELESGKDKYIRLYSEFENFRKRTAKEKLELIQSANEQLIVNLLPVIDDFDRAENAFPDKDQRDIAGFFLIQSKFKKVLELYGVKPMDIGQGSAFDADFHEAVSQVPAPAPELKGKIVDVIEKGYFLHDKVIRYAKVVVGN